MANLYTLAGSSAEPLLSEKYLKLKSDDERAAQQETAERLLNLSEPAYTGAQMDAIQLALVHQINFQLEHGMTPEVMRSIGNAHSGLNTSYRDRWLSPVAWRIIEVTTGVQYVGFRAPGFGV